MARPTPDPFAAEAMRHEGRWPRQIAIWHRRCSCRLSNAPNSCYFGPARPRRPSLFRPQCVPRLIAAAGVSREIARQLACLLPRPMFSNQCSGVFHVNPPRPRRSVAGDRRAQFRDAALGGIERVTAVERGFGRLADERRRRQVALADPQGNEPLPAAAVVEHFELVTTSRVVGPM
jgi:hypothetical protein